MSLRYFAHDTLAFLLFFIRLRPPSGAHVIFVLHVIVVLYVLLGESGERGGLGLHSLPALPSGGYVNDSIQGMLRGLQGMRGESPITRRPSAIRGCSTRAQMGYWRAKALAR